MGQAPLTVQLEDDRVAKRDYSAEFRPQRAGKGWPLVDYACGVHASQAKELHEYFAAKGVPTDVTPQGDPVWRDASHRKRGLACRGFFDRAAFC